MNSKGINKKFTVYHLLFTIKILTIKKVDIPGYPIEIYKILLNGL